MKKKNCNALLYSYFCQHLKGKWLILDGYMTLLIVFTVTVTGNNQIKKNFFFLWFNMVNLKFILVVKTVEFLEEKEAKEKVWFYRFDKSSVKLNAIVVGSFYNNRSSEFLDDLYNIDKLCRIINQTLYNKTEQLSSETNWIVKAIFKFKIQNIWSQNVPCVVEFVVVVAVVVVIILMVIFVL